IIRQQAQPPTCELLRHGAANIAKADDAQGAPGHAINRFLAMHAPSALRHFLMSRNDSADSSEQQRDGMHRNFIHTIDRNVPHNNFHFCRIIDYDILVPYDLDVIDLLTVWTLSVL